MLLWNVDDVDAAGDDGGLLDDDNCMIGFWCGIKLRKYKNLEQFLAYLIRNERLTVPVDEGGGGDDGSA